MLTRNHWLVIHFDPAWLPLVDPEFTLERVLFTMRATRERLYVDIFPEHTLHQFISYTPQCRTGAELASEDSFQGSCMEF